MLCCPRCGGPDIYEEIGGYAGTIYRCKQCGYRGAFIVEIHEDEDRKPRDAGGRRG